MNDQSRAVWLQTSLYINTTPGNNDNDRFRSAILRQRRLGRRGRTAALSAHGVAAPPSTSPSKMIAALIVMDHPQPQPRDQVAFTGDIATLAGPDGSHFLGKDEPNIVIGFDSTGTHNIGRDIPLDPNSSSVENQSGSTYHIGIGNGPFGLQPDQTLEGSAARLRRRHGSVAVYPGSPSGFSAF